MSLLVWLSFCSLFGVAFSCEAYIKTNQWSDRSVIVQMFEWKWLDIADECERFLGPKKYGAVQTSPASENLVLEINGVRPWYERYQVMSYKLTTRSGDEAAFLNMTTRCNKVGVRIYVDVVFNHMVIPQNTTCTLVGTAGSTAVPENYSYPAVPYTDEHFHFPVCQVENYENATELRVCQLGGLQDLNQTQLYVRKRIIEYLNILIELGVAGFRVDAAKHMWPNDLNEIYKYLDNLNTNHGFRKNSRPYIYQEVSKGGVVTYKEYKDMGDVTEFTAGAELAQIFTGGKPLKTLSLYGSTGLDMMPSENAVVFVDNHDTQRNGFILSYKNSTLYKAALAFLLAHPYGQARITSSFYFTGFDEGPPADSNNNIKSPVLDADEQCTTASGWVCEHRWSTVYKMVAFRNEVHNTEVTNWWDNGNNQIAFSLGNKGFIAFNTEGSTLDRQIQTGLPAGIYCDIISGKKQGNACTGKNVTVSRTGLAQVALSGVGEELYLAIHVGTETMTLFVGLSFCSLFAVAFSCQAYIKTNQWADRSVIVQMFEWKWLDIADECERFLGPKNYGAVQTSPASENLVLYLDGGVRPWYERYQVMSYQLTTRSGDEAAFLNMTTRCNKVGVRIYVDVVFNHMTGGHDSSVGTAGSTANTETNSFPGVPYTDEHFHHPVCDFSDENNATEVRVCQLSGLKDLNQTMPYVRQKIINYLNKLIDLGVAGLRVDAAKHMWPADLNEIFNSLNNLNTNHGFRKNSRPYIYQEVSKGGVVTYKEYKGMGDVTEFTAGAELAQIFTGGKPLKTLSLYGSTGLDMMPTENAVVFVDNHDTQRSGFILSYKNSTLYKAALAFLLAHPYGQARITSSFYFTGFDEGPPADSNENIKSPVLDENEQCTIASGWVCEHRWSTVYKMVAFRNEVHNTEVTNWWDNDNNQIAFSLGNKGFIAFNTEGSALDRQIQTGLPAGTYCDIISGQKQGNACTGKSVTVSSTGLAQVTLSGVGEELYLAIHVGAESALQSSR